MGPETVTVLVNGRIYPVTASKDRAGVWTVSGRYHGQDIEVTGSSARQALLAWQAAAAGSVDTMLRRSVPKVKDQLST
jgi:hypothetical protein